CNTILKKFGVETTYYDPMIGEGISALIQPNTKILFTESPGSITMEIQDIPTLARIAHQHNIIVMMDNTWAAGIQFAALQHGVD
ncbi:PLP-dependent transferase, partial [Escherichia coli]